MQKPSWYRSSVLFLALAAGACSTDTTTKPRDGGAHEGDDPDGGKTNLDSGQPGDTTAKLGDGVAGKACRTDGDCAGTNARCVTMVGGVMGLLSTPTPGGYCTGDCAENSDCGSGGVCSTTGLGAGSCVASCDDDRDCTRSGYYCAAGLDVVFITLPASCLPRPETDQLANGIVGTPCTRDSQCGDGYCADTLGGVSVLGQSGGGRPAPGGYCTGACLEDSECGSNGLCAALIPNQAGTCYLECGNSCDRDGYHCGPVVGGNGGGNAGGGGGFPGGGGGGFFGGAGGILGGGGFEIPNACVPEPVVDGGAEGDSGVEEDGGTPDAAVETDSGAHDSGTNP